MSATLDWITPCEGYALRIAAESWQQIERECRRSGSVETGGILVGYYTKDESTALVTEALPPPKDSSCGGSWFRRGVAGLRALLTKRWESDLRTYYIGEWHYHPASTLQPSRVDLAQMFAINADPEYRCREPVMIIVGRGLNGSERPVRVFVFPRRESVIELVRSERRGAAGADLHGAAWNLACSSRRRSAVSRASWRDRKSPT